MNNVFHSSRFWQAFCSTVSTFFCISLLTGLLSGCGQTIPVTTDEFDTFGIGVIPRLDGVLNLMVQPDEPFVAMNALVFKEQATGEEYEGLTGEEAYMIYTEGLSDTLAQMNSRLIWTGRVQHQILGESDPAFEAFGLLEYSSPKNLLQLMTDPGDAPEARTAGLYGQWNISSQTLDETGLRAVSVTQETLPDMAELVLLTGMTEEQINLLLESPADEPVFVVEMMRFSDTNGVQYAPFRDALTAVYEFYGAALIWRGEFDYFFIGIAKPEFHQMVVTMFPNPAAYLLMLCDPQVTAALNAKKNGLAIHWAYTAVKLDSTPNGGSTEQGGNGGCDCSVTGTSTDFNLLQLMISGLVYLLPLGFIRVRLRLLRCQS
jgi:hypothetical protein